MGQATASLVINYGSLDAGDILLAAELDEERNNGRTSFNAGDPVFFKVFSDTEYHVKSTDGVAVKIVDLETDEVKEEVLQFIHVKRSGLTKKAISLDSFRWFGNNLGAINLVSVSEVEAANANETTTIGICKVDYTTEYDVWQLQAPAGMPALYAILIVIIAGPDPEAV